MTADFRPCLRRLTFRWLRACFRILPLGDEGREALRHWFAHRFPAFVPMDQDDQAALVPPHPAEHAYRARTRTDLRAIGFMPHALIPLPTPLPATLVAFYLPQYHPIPENDAWWGRGFTEWRNVARALPQFEGHAQPRLPGDLGFYDLRILQTMRDQAELARDHGISAFCFYFYWFQGRTLLHAPVEQWLQDHSITLPFCLCWANEGWSRRWDGRPGEVLLEQVHDADDDLAFIAHVARFLRDPRYLHVDGKPLLLVYRPELMPDPAATARRWRQWCADNGIGGITIACVQAFESLNPNEIGFDVAIEFPPNLSSPKNVTARQVLINPDYAGEVFDWRDIVAEYRERPAPPYRLFPGVNCGWDNEPRRPGQGRTYQHAAPRRYRDWLQHTIEVRLAEAPASDRLVFVNAWNEWAEGAVLEPDARLGYAWLRATGSALVRAASPAPISPCRPCVVVHAWDAEAFDEILVALGAWDLPFRLVVTTVQERVTEIQRTLESHDIDAELLTGPNHGRDILPFLRVADRLLEEGEDVVLKLHTKQSIHRQNGSEWRRDLLARLLAPRRASRLHAAFVADPDLGLVAPEGHVQPLSHYWGANKRRVHYLVSRTGLPPLRADSNFVAGSMFWVRLEALRQLLDAHLDEWEFEPESGQIDGTCSHAVERLFASFILAGGYRVATAAAICRDSAQAVDDAPYPYAERS